MNNYNLKGRRAIVTGGAQGFGFAITKRFLESGAEVIIWDIDQKAVDEALKELSSEKCSHQIVDVTNFDDKLPGMDNSIIQANMLVRQAKVSIEDTEETWKSLLDQNNNLSKVATILGICLKFKYPKLPLSERRVLALARLIQDSMPLSMELVKSSKSYDVEIIYEDEAVYARGRTLNNLN